MVSFPLSALALCLSPYLCLTVAFVLFSCYVAQFLVGKLGAPERSLDGLPDPSEQSEQLPSPSSRELGPRRVQEIRARFTSCVESAPPPKNIEPHISPCRRPEKRDVASRAWVRDMVRTWEEVRQGLGRGRGRACQHDSTSKVPEISSCCLLASSPGAYCTH